MKERIFTIYQNRPTVPNLIQGLSMFIKSISIDRLRVKPAMTERFISMGEREQVSFAKQTDMNLSPFTSHFSRECKRYAFTLAETLITLGIIGVVAAVTLPSVIEKHQKQVTVTKLKKAYSIVAQAVEMSKTDNDDLELWNYTLPAKDFYNTYLKNYIQSTEEIPIQEIKKHITYTYLNGNTDRGALNVNNSYATKLIDGTFIYIDGWYSNDVDLRNIIIDINGFKAPNRTGKDTFFFQIYPAKGVTCYGFYNNRVISDCSKDTQGYQCSCKIMADGWKISDDYPW